MIGERQREPWFSVSNSFEILKNFSAIFDQAQRCTSSVLVFTFCAYSLSNFWKKNYKSQNTYEHTHEYVTIHQERRMGRLLCENTKNEPWPSFKSLMQALFSWISCSQILEPRPFWLEMADVETTNPAQVPVVFFWFLVYICWCSPVCFLGPRKRQRKGMCVFSLVIREDTFILSSCCCCCLYLPRSVLQSPDRRSRSRSRSPRERSKSRSRSRSRSKSRSRSPR